jgi:Zn-dependent protease
MSAVHFIECVQMTRWRRYNRHALSDLGSGLIYYVVFLFSTTLHEAAHAWAAMRGGDPTAYHGGQVSLDPRPHMRREPFGMIALPLISVALSGWPFGFARTPYDSHWAAQYPKRAAWMALAGPGGNLLLVVAAAVAIRIGSAVGVFATPGAVTFDQVISSSTSGAWSGVAFLVSVFFSLNLLLAIFNLIPVPPLDGSGAVPLFLDDATTSRYQRFIWGQPAFAWIGILIAWQIFPSLFQPLWLFAVNLVHPGVHYG